MDIPLEPVTESGFTDPHSGVQTLTSADLSAIEDADFQAVTQASTLQGQANKQVQLFAPNSSKGDIISTLSKQVPANEYGLPLFYYRSDLLPLQEIQTLGYVNQDDLDAGASQLFYEDGYPTFQNGSPFWTRMEYEPTTAYALFQAYLDMGETDGIRVLDTLATRHQVGLSQLREHYGEFYWSSRARAYDLFIVAAEQKKREHRIRSTENKHYNKAGELLEVLTSKLGTDVDTWLDKLMENPKDAIEALDKLAKLQRLSLGLTGQNSSTNNGAPNPASSVEVILRNLTKNSGGGEQDQGDFRTRLSGLLSDPTLALQAQELIIRANGSNTTPGSQ